MLNLLNPHELFAEDCVLPVEFRFGAVGVAKGLDPGSTQPDIPRHAHIGVPLWLVPDLHRRGMVNLELPEVYNERYRRKMNAGAECISLRNRAPYFFDVGLKLNAMAQDLELSSHLSRTFKTRYQELISKGLNTMTGEEVLELHCKLSIEEQQLFEGGRASIVATEKWLQNDYSDHHMKNARRKRPAQPGQDGTKQQRV